MRAGRDTAAGCDPTESLSGSRPAATSPLASRVHARCVRSDRASMICTSCSSGTMSASSARSGKMALPNARACVIGKAPRRRHRVAAANDDHSLGCAAGGNSSCSQSDPQECPRGVEVEEHRAMAQVRELRGDFGSQGIVGAAMAYEDSTLRLYLRGRHVAWPDRRASAYGCLSNPNCLSNAAYIARPDRARRESIRFECIHPLVLFELRLPCGALHHLRERIFPVLHDARRHLRRAEKAAPVFVHDVVSLLDERRHFLKRPPSRFGELMASTRMRPASTCVMRSSPPMPIST